MEPARGYGRGHLQQRWIPFYREEAGHRHAANLGDTPKIIANHIHNHHILRAILGGGPQQRHLFLIFCQRFAAHGRSFHRSRTEQIPIQAKEKFRRGRANYILAEI
jgi:hypothetical protein